MEISIKERVCAMVDELRGELLEVSRLIHENPETRFEEHRAVEWLCAVLESRGHAVERGVAGLPTAFRSSMELAGQGRVVAFVAEYDGLPVIGHGCGHNLIAGASLGAFLALEAVGAHLPGTVSLLGTPGEEGGGGKVTMLSRGAFAGCDAALMFHPAPFTVMIPATLTTADVTVSFRGRASHAAANPENGINALDGVINTFNSMNALRGYMRRDARVHGIITRGGESQNVIPEAAEAVFSVRAKDVAYRSALVQELKRCAEGAALASGARVTVTNRGVRNSLTTNRRLISFFTANLVSLGERTRAGQPRPFSTDMGDVSHSVPSIHPTISICEEGVSLHSTEFARAAGSERGREVMLTAAKALAMTAVDLLTAVQEPHSRRRAAAGERR